MMDTSFKPTELDLALARDPTAEAKNRDLTTAASENGGPAAIVPYSEPAHGRRAEHPASREGQKQTAAASLAAGMIAAEGRPVTAAEAVEKVQEVLDQLPVT